MKIAVIASNGKVGSRVVAEAKERGHEIITIARKDAVINKDLFDLTVEDIKDADVLVSAFGTWSDQSLHLKVTKFLDKLMKEADKLWYVVGGAGSLYVADDLQLLNTEAFPKEYYDVAYGMKVGFDFLLNEGQSVWSYFSPAAVFAPGEKTGKYKLGKDNLITNKDGKSYISMEDYAVALIDVIEEKKFVKERFTAVQE